MARILDQVLGHEHQISMLQLAVENNHLPQANLFIGPSGVGKKLIAMGLAQSLLCQSHRLACGICASCLRVEKKQHESLKIIQPEKNLIKIEQAREILDFLSLRALTQNRVVIIDHAESLNSQAANSLLKIIEEPSPGTYFFMIAPSASHVLPTVRSRTQIVSFQSLTENQIRQQFQKVGAHELNGKTDWAIKASLGSFERLQQLTDEHSLESRELAKVFLKTSLQIQSGYLEPKIKEMIRERSQAVSLARNIVLFLRDAVFLQNGQQNKVINADETELLQGLAEKKGEQLFAVAQNSLQLEKYLLQNRDSQLVFEQFWIENLC